MSAIDRVVLIGQTTGHLGASLYSRVWLGLKNEGLGPPPVINLKQEREVSDLVRKLITDGLVNAVHDVSDGGIACAAAELAIASNVGITLDGKWSVSDFFGEDQARILLAVPINSASEVLKRVRRLMYGLDNTRIDIGSFSSQKRFVSNSLVFDLDVLKQNNEDWLPTYMNSVD